MADRKKYFDSFRIMSPDGDEIDIKLYTKSTRNYNYEYATAERGLAYVAEGSYRWMNRPWQSYDFDVALGHMCRGWPGKTKNSTSSTRRNATNGDAKSPHA